MSEFEERKNEVLEILRSLNQTVYAAFDEIKALKQPNSTAYSYAIINRGQALCIRNKKLSDRGYLVSIPCPDYEAWKTEIIQVNKIVEKYGGGITVEGLKLERYLSEVGNQNSLEEVKVKIVLPGQGNFHQLKQLLW